MAAISTISRRRWCNGLELVCQIEFGIGKHDDWDIFSQYAIKVVAEDVCIVEMRPRMRVFPLAIEDRVTREDLYDV